LEDIVKTKFTNGDYEAAGVHTKTLSVFLFEIIGT
jgi:hypothetical protein